ncbi:MAG: rfbD [Enterovirga sp.]|jgi:dTDP-4-dehydrorhamnose reductase|nr:rfbD [Enterovirga sp.]
MRILVTGGTGQVGIELQALDWGEGTVLDAPGRDTLDLADAASIERVLSARSYDAVISSGAYTAVDKAESEVAEAWRVNALAPAVLAAGAARAGIPIVHLSTDYVFAGTKSGAYLEDDPVAPINVYGASKEGGEQAVRSANPRHAIVRTAWVVSPHGKNFVKTMLRVGADRDELTVVADQRGCPTFAADLAAAIRGVTQDLVRKPGAPTGTYHFVNAGEAAWSDFATAIFAGSARRGGPSARVRPITTAEYPTPARRPGNSRLSTAKIERDFGIRPRPWQEALDDALDVLLPGQ